MLRCVGAGLSLSQSLPAPRRCGCRVHGIAHLSGGCPFGHAEQIVAVTKIGEARLAEPISVSDAPPNVEPAVVNCAFLLKGSELRFRDRRSPFLITVPGGMILLPENSPSMGKPAVARQRG